MLDRMTLDEEKYELLLELTFIYLFFFLPKLILTFRTVRSSTDIVFFKFENNIYVIGVVSQKHFTYNF